MRNWRSQFDMAHTFAADFLQRDFNAALFADDAAIFHAFVFAAKTFVIADRAKDASAEQTVAFWLEGTVIDGFRLLDFAERPGTNAFRRRNRDADLVKALRCALLIEDIH